MQSGGCGESEKRVELTRPVEAVELGAMRLKDEKRGMLWFTRVGDRRSYGILAQNFSLETRVTKKMADNLLAELAPVSISGIPRRYGQLSDLNCVWNWR
jgi:hypothetical protein